VVKKLIVLVTAFIMLFSLMACNVKNFEDHKEAAKSSLDAHVATNIESDYAPEYWTAMLERVSDGKIAIDAAKSKVGVDKAVKMAKIGVDEALMEAKMKYNAVIYGVPYIVRSWMKDDFFENNLTHGSWSYAQEQYVQGDEYPQQNNIIIRNLDEFKEAFAKFPVEVDFKKDMILVHGITTASNRELILTDAVLDGQTLYIKYWFPALDGPAPPNASMPLTKWTVVKMDKLDIKTVVFLQSENK
jgi:hypothetical protein